MNRYIDCKEGHGRHFDKNVTLDHGVRNSLTILKY
jgi:hypothetical protein